MIPQLRLAAPVFCGLVASAVWAEEPADLLERMGTALEEASYRGVIIHQQATKTDTFKVFHTMRDGVVRERLVRQEGDGVEIIRNGNQVHCVIPEKQVVLMEAWNGQGRLFSAISDDVESLSGAYDLEISGKERIAGRKAVVVSITPRDRLRFARRLWLDVESGFPLKSERSDTQGNLVDRIRFADIELGADLTEQDFRSRYPLDDFSWYPSPEPVVSRETVDWWSEKLPVGFRKESGHIEKLDQKESAVTHIVYTDGLSRVSVFIKTGKGDPATSRGRVGNAHSFSTQRDGYRITAVGEVPPAAVEQIALSMRR